MQALNQAALRDAGGTHEGIEGMISAYELAFRMQDTLPEVIDVAKEPESIRDLYGLDDEATSASADSALPHDEWRRPGSDSSRLASAAGTPTGIFVKNSPASALPSIDRSLAC